ncbi:Arm DNA-binding domain-containing protein [Thalassotalea litorea]
MFVYTKTLTGKRTTMGLGAFPEISPKQAREMRAEPSKLQSR